MPSFDDARLDAAQLSAASRALAYATRQDEDPGDSYAILGELQATLITLHQSVHQLAAMHRNLAERAVTDDGDQAAGRHHADTAAARLDATAAHLDQATDELMAAFAENGHIAWQPITTRPTRRSRSLNRPAGPSSVPA